MTRPMSSSRRRGAWRIFRWPLIIAAATLCGLVSALVGDGAYDVASWLLLGGDIALMVLFLTRRNARAQTFR